MEVLIIAGILVFVIMVGVLFWTVCDTRNKLSDVRFIISDVRNQTIDNTMLLHVLAERKRQSTKRGEA